TFTSAARGSYTFNYSATGKQQEVTANDGAAGDDVGKSVAISGDTVVVGADDHTVGSNTEQGAVYVFTQSGTTWTLQQELTADEGQSQDFCGVSVGISGDTIVVGADNHAVGNIVPGVAYVFTRNGTTWTQQQELTAADAQSQDSFGVS